jgi:hypothetical protein
MPSQDEQNQDFLTLVTISDSLKAVAKETAFERFRGSRFQWIMARGSSEKGKIGEELVSAWARTNGFDVTKTGDRAADRIINGHRIEIKFSSRWRDKNEYWFQQVRDQDYDFCFCLGVSPFEVHAWLIPKGALLDHIIGHKGQHGGEAAKETALLKVPIGAEPDWIKPYGNRLSDVKRIFELAGTGSKFFAGAKKSRKKNAGLAAEGQ